VGGSAIEVTTRTMASCVQTEPILPNKSAAGGRGRGWGRLSP
jgi:hypothetical protein